MFLPLLAEVTVIFLGPLAMAGVATLFYLSSDAERWSKWLALVMMAGSLILQFGTNVHFLAPLSIQLVVCIWMALYFQLD